MGLIFEGQQVGKTVQNFTEYSLPGSPIRFIIIHGSPQSYWVGLPTNISIPRTLEIFRHIVGIEPPESEKPLEVSLHEERDVHRKGITHYPLDVDPAVIEKKLFEKLINKD